MLPPRFSQPLARVWVQGDSPGAGHFGPAGHSSAPWSDFMKRWIVLAAVAAGVASAPLAAQDPPLIPRATLFGNPDKAAGRISPDGKWLSFLAPSDGVLNVWVAPADKPDQA